MKNHSNPLICGSSFVSRTVINRMKRIKKLRNE